MSGHDGKPWRLIIDNTLAVTLPGLGKRSVSREAAQRGNSKGVGYRGNVIGKVETHFKDLSTLGNPQAIYLL